MPETIKIGGQIVNVEMADLVSDGCYADWDYQTNTIRIEQNMPDTQKEAALLHEIMHVLNANFDEGFGHAFMESFSQQLYQVLKDNKIHF